MRRFTLLIASLLLMASAASPATNPADQLANRCQRLKQRLSPPSQQVLSKIQLGFDAALTGNPRIRSSELGRLARKKAREGFPKAGVDQLDAVAVVLLSDWVVRQKVEVRRWEGAKAVEPSRGKPPRPGGSAEPLNSDSELAMIRLNDLIGQAELAVEQMSKLMEDQNKTMEQLLDHF
jgi:hypothetical protein